MQRRAGGQAVVNGVMMRGDRQWAVAVRTPAGDITVHREALPAWGRRWRRVPVVRGLVALAQVVPIGVRAMRWSTVHGLERASRRWVSALRLLGFLAAVVFVPPLLVDGLWAENFVTLAVAVGYAAAVGRLRMVGTLFEYHGAEHKVVAADEAGIELTPDTVAPFSTRHPRCGTSLLLAIVVVAALLSMLPIPTVVLVPLVAGLAIELQRASAGNFHRRWVRAAVQPGLVLQRLTTREPSSAQVEVAIAALHAAYAEVPSYTSATQPSSVAIAGVPA